MTSTSIHGGSMGLGGKIGEGRRNKLLAFITPYLQPGEGIEAMVPMTQTGNPSFLGILLHSYFGLVLTNHNLYFVRWRNAVPETPTEVFAAVPRHWLTGGHFHRGFGSGTLQLSGSNGDQVRLKVAGMHRDDAERMFQVLAAAQQRVGERGR